MTEYPNVFEKYHLQVDSDKQVKAWNSNPTQFWQNQLNFAVWCASTGCGVSIKDHLNAADPMMRSLYRFHVYLQIRRILHEMVTSLPQDDAWHAKNNPYDRREYERICNEFGVSPHSDWRASGPNRGLGQIYNYHTHRGYYPLMDGYGRDAEYDQEGMSFTKETTNDVLHIDFIKQKPDTSWGEFILHKSDGFTRAGVERLNDSIRTYVYIILGAQGDARAGILGTGKAFTVQDQFLEKLKDSIEHRKDLPTAISRYQAVLEKARSEVNYSFGVGLYMAPSDMQLRIGSVVGYNNLIVVATESQSLGLNKGLNKPATPPNASNDTGEVGIVKPPPKSDPPPPPSHNTPAVHEPRQHEEEKAAIVVGALAIGLVALWFM